MKLTRIFAFIIALTPLAAQAAADNFVIDKAHSNIIFLINHQGFSRMIGRFNDFSGEYTFDEANFANNKAKVVINAQSVDTNHQKRDEHLRGADFFNVKEFPTITISGSKMEKTGEKTGKLTLNVTLLGVTKPAVLDVTLNKKAENKGMLNSGFSAKGSIKRSDFGMKYGLPNVGDEVELIIEVEGKQ